MPSEYAKWLQRDVAPEDKGPEPGRWAKFCTWMRYNWGIVLCIVIVIGVGVSLLFSALGFGKVKPDYQVAYVGTDELPEDTVDALCEALEALGEDLNGDGQVVVQVNQYYTTSDTEDETGAMTAYASEVSLIADINDCESYFFLVEDPDDFQTKYQLLATEDGGCPEDTDTDGMGKVYQWANCPVLAGIDLGEYTISLMGETATGDSNELVQTLYLGRRCFYLEDTVENPEGCEALWEALTEGAVR
ncbi:MAG: hypothetical protein LUF28_00905 [Clostridiales bacterium]|nr:hypothetical protein [Clostridiales bacterium]